MSVRLPALAFGALVVGSAVTADPAGLAPFGPSKWLVVSTLAFLTATLSLRYGSVLCHRQSWWMWVALITLLTLAALSNGDAKTAMLGHPDRHLGVLTWVLFFAMFCAGQQLAQRSAALVRAGSLSALLLGLYSLWELVFGPPIEAATATRRLLGPFGSAAFLGAACCLLGPVALAVAFDRSQDRRWRWVGGTATMLVAIAVLGSGTRAAWVGLAVAAIVVSVALRPGRQAILWCAAGLLVAVVIVSPRLHDVSSREGGGSRLDEWRVAARVISHHPVLGVGPEGYRIAVADGIDDAYERSYRRDTVLPDRAHSGVLDVTLSGGVAAGLLYVALVGFVCRRAWQAIRSRRPVSVGLGAAVIAYGEQQLLLFPLAELDPIWWFFAGAVVTITSSGTSSGTSAGTPADAHVERKHVVVPALAAAASAVMLVVGVLDVAADRLAHTALRSRDLDAAIASADQAVSLRPDNIRYRLVAAAVHLDRGTLADIDKAIEQARRATAWSSNDPFAVEELATAMYRRAAVTGDVNDVAAALAEWQRLVDRDRHRARWQLQLGRAAALAGDSERARTAWTVAGDLGAPGADELLAALGASS